MISERMLPFGYPPSINKFRPDQMATINTWTTVPDQDTEMAALHSIHIVQQGSTTVTEVNPLDPGDGGYWLDKPHARGPVPKHNRYW